MSTKHRSECGKPVIVGFTCVLSHYPIEKPINHIFIQNAFVFQRVID